MTIQAIPKQCYARQEPLFTYIELLKHLRQTVICTISNFASIYPFIICQSPKKKINPHTQSLLTPPCNGPLSLPLSVNELTKKKITPKICYSAFLEILTLMFDGGPTIMIAYICALSKTFLDVTENNYNLQ